MMTPEPFAPIRAACFLALALAQRPQARGEGAAPVGWRFAPGTAR